MQVVGGDARAGEVGLTLSGGCADEAEDGAADAPVPGSGVAGATTPPESSPVAVAPAMAMDDVPPRIVQPRAEEAVSVGPKIEEVLPSGASPPAKVEPTRVWAPAKAKTGAAPVPKVRR